MLPSYNATTFVATVQLADGVDPSIDNRYRWIINDPHAPYANRVVASPWQSTASTNGSTLVDVGPLFYPGLHRPVLQWFPNPPTPLPSGQVLRIQLEDDFQLPTRVTATLECDPPGCLIFSDVTRYIGDGSKLVLAA